MTTQQIAWIVISCLGIMALGPILMGLRVILMNRRGEEGEMPEGYRFMLGSISMGQKAVSRLPNPFAQEEADLAELADLTNKLKQEEEQSD